MIEAASSNLPTYLATYGSLMSGFPAQRELGVDSLLELVGACVIRGDLFDLGDYPGLSPGEGSVHGELYRVLDERVFHTLDPFEVYDPAAPETSLYQRKHLRLVEPQVDAWVYVMLERPEPARLLKSGCWRQSSSSASG